MEAIDVAQQANAAVEREHTQLSELAGGPRRPGIDDYEVTYMSNVRMEDAEELFALRKRAAEKRRVIRHQVENIARQDFGVRNAGEGWISETLLTRLIQQQFPDQELFRHHRPLWLEGLELDIWLPDLRLGIEYQGQQHFHANRAMGRRGCSHQLAKTRREELNSVQANGVLLLTVDYTEPVTPEHISQPVEEVLAD